MNLVAPPEAPVDGRAARWEQHNVDRRRALVEDAVRAIRELGPGVGMDEIAARAKTSKTVLYRHFGDKSGLYRAVVESVEQYILRKLPLDDAELVVASRPTGEVPTEDPVLTITTHIGNAVAEAMRAWLGREGLDEDPANIWAHGVTGFIWAVADRWIVTNLRRPRAEVVAYIDSFFAPAFAAQQRS